MRLFFSVFVCFILFVLGCGEAVVTQPEFTPPPPSNPFNSLTVTGSVVNLRQGPGTQYAVVGRAYAGDSLLVTGETLDWYRVYLPEKSLFAWIYSALTSGASLPE